MKPPQMEFITIGRILTTWGVKGKLKVKPETDFPQRFARGARVYIDRQPMTISDSEWHGNRLAVKLETINSPEDARKLQGKVMEIHRSQVHPLPEGQYYHFQLIGLEVRTTRGEPLGNITEIISAVSNDTYVVILFVLHYGHMNSLSPHIVENISDITLGRHNIRGPHNGGYPS